MLRLLVAATLVGSATALGALPVLVARQVSRRSYDTLLGFGAGLMLGAATLGLLPAALRDVRVNDHVDLNRLLVVLAGFLGGVGLLSLMDRLIPHVHAGGHHAHDDGHDAHDHHAHCRHQSIDETARHQGLLVLGAMSLHRLPEGFALGAGFSAGHLEPLGIVLTVALSIQNAVEGAVMAAPLRRGGLAPLRLMALVIATGLAVPAAALLGHQLSAAADALPAGLALAAGALIYLTCNEIIPESHSHKNERFATLGLLGGFVLIILVQTLAGHVD